MVLEEGIENIVNEKGIVEVLKKVGKKITLIGSIVEKRSNMVGHQSNCSTTLIERMIKERSRRERPKQEYMDGVKEE